MASPEKQRPALAGPLALGAAVMAWLTGWIFYYGPTLINDEYAAIDYFYRIVRGGFFPTPDKLHKPLSVVLGVFAWAAESPLGYELATAAFASMFAVLAWRIARRELGPTLGGIAAAIVILHPDFVYYTVTGSTVIPFCALSFLGLYAVLRREENDRWLWVYAGSFMLAGLTRPESWLFAGPLVLWWTPRDRRGWVRLIAAGAVIGFAPVFWFGADYLINGDLMHGMKIAVRDKTIGMGKPFDALSVAKFWWVRVANIISWPVAVGGVLGIVVFFRERGFRNALLHPFVIFPPLVAGYVWLIVYQGVFPVQRYYYFNSVFMLYFCLLFAGRAAAWLTADRGTAAAQSAIWAGVIGAVANLLHPGGDGQGALIAAGLVAAAAALALVRGRALFRPVRSLIAAGMLTFLALSFGVFCLGYYGREYEELKLEAGKQEQLTEVAEWLKGSLRSDQRLLLPTRRNEQFSWAWRERALPETFFFREIYYLHYYRGVEILDLQPDWIIWVDNDFQFWGPQDIYGWLGHQDRTEIKGAVIELRHSTPLIRVLDVTYPPGHPPKPPLPQIPLEQ